MEKPQKETKYVNIRESSKFRKVGPKVGEHVYQNTIFFVFSGKMRILKIKLNLKHVWVSPECHTSGLHAGRLVD